MSSQGRVGLAKRHRKIKPQGTSSRLQRHRCLLARSQVHAARGEALPGQMGDRGKVAQRGDELHGHTPHGDDGQECVHWKLAHAVGATDELSQSNRRAAEDKHVEQRKENAPERQTAAEQTAPQAGLRDAVAVRRLNLAGSDTLADEAAREQRREEAAEEGGVHERQGHVALEVRQERNRLLAPIQRDVDAEHERQVNHVRFRSAHPEFRRSDDLAPHR
mmetsp:Transcript_51333/g.130556  ORF Transcript_51333/g.130556 Transcript_51333/m.130556 type:complete len:219 (+) Transcript_51333:23-679(+)